MFAILVVNSIIDRGPLVFLSLAEKFQSQADAVYFSEHSGSFNEDLYIHWVSEGFFTNYTQAQALNPENNFSPRKQFWASHFTDPNIPEDTTLARVTLINTEREKEIELGTMWPYPALKAGECLAPEENLKEPLLNVGDELSVSINMPYTIDAIRQFYNSYAEVTPGSRRWLVTDPNSLNIINTTCTI